MKPEALITLLLAEGVVFFFTAYFFWKVLTIPPRPEPDSFSENGNEPRP
jgi:hypothetical protein